MGGGSAGAGGMKPTRCSESGSSPAPQGSLDAFWLLVVESEGPGSPPASPRAAAAAAAAGKSPLSDPVYVKYVALTTLAGALVNVVLSGVKVAFGVWYRSHALVADGIHSLSDVVSDAVTILATWFGNRPLDASFPYGYGKWETLATLWVAALLLMGAGSLIVHLKGEFDGLSEGTPVVQISAVWVALASVVAKEVSFQVTHRIGVKLESDLLIANAWHHRSDAMSSLAALAGIIGAVAGFAVADLIAGVVVAGLMGKVGLDIGWGALKTLADASTVDELEAPLKAAVEALHTSGGLDRSSEVVPGSLRARRAGRKSLCDVRLRVRRDTRADDAARQASALSAELRRLVPHVADATVVLDVLGGA